ncbi:MAG: Uma2 family endonuclease [Gemmatimonadales bacterium]
MFAHDPLLPEAEENHIMGMATGQASVTTMEELLALPEDGLRHELLDGEHVVTPAPELPHQAVVGELYGLLIERLRGHDELVPFISPADVVLGPKTLVQPDLFVVRKQPGQRLRKWSEVGVPVLAIEILSPGTASRDRGTKRRIYQLAGVAEYWIVDLDARLVERWRPEDERPEVVSDVLRWEPAAGVAAAVDLPSLFTRVLGEP